MRVVVVADTHLTRDAKARLPLPLLHAMEGADHVLHAGDVVSAAALDELGAIAPLSAVLGNNDLELAQRLPAQLLLSLAGVEVAMIHDAGARGGRPARLARRFPGAAIVVYGHSHVPDLQRGVGEQLLFNPGSPTQRRAQPHASYGVLELADGAVVHAEILELPS